MTKNTKISQKMQKTQMCVFAQSSERKIFSFCVKTIEPIIAKTCQAPENDCHNLSFVKKNTHVLKNWPEKVLQRSFINSVSFLISL